MAGLRHPPEPQSPAPALVVELQVEAVGEEGLWGEVAAAVVAPPAEPPPLEGHVGNTWLEFVLTLRHQTRRSLRLPRPFSAVIEGDHLRGL